MQGLARNLLSEEMQADILNTGGRLPDFALIVANLGMEGNKLEMKRLKEDNKRLKQHNSQALAVQQLTFDLKETNGELMRVSGYLGGRGLLGKDYICSV